MSTQPVSESPEKAFESRDVMAVVPQDGVKRALLIATGSFVADGIPSLDGVDPDVALIRDRLLDSRCGFKPENVVVLESRHSPSLKKIKRALEDFLRSCRPNDFIFLYFAGHGFRCADVDYYVPCDAKPIFEADKTVSFEASSCFSFKDLRERIGACSAKFKWVIVDACRTNHTARDVFDGDSWNSIGELKAAKGSLWFQSCGLNQKSYEIKFIENGQTKNHGLFTWYFCEGAKGKAADKFGKISPRTLFNYACKKIQDECGGNCAIRQQPLFSCDDLSSDNFVFVDLSEAPAYRAKRLYDEASALCVGGKYEQAQEKIGEAIEIEPNNPEYKKLEVRVKVGVHINKGLRCFSKHKYAEVKREAELALELDPENPDALALKEAANNPTSNPVPPEPKRPPKVESEPKPPRKVDREAAAKHVLAGNEAFNNKDYLLAREEAEKARDCNPYSDNVDQLLEKTELKLNELAQDVREGVELLQAKKYEDAIKKARAIKSLCVNYPKANDLEDDAIKGWGASLLESVEKESARVDRDSIRAKVCQALQIEPDDSDFKELEKKAIASVISALILGGEKDLKGGDVHAARERACQALALDPYDARAQEWEKETKKALIGPLVDDGWEAFGKNDKKGALVKAREALKLDPNDQEAKNLLFAAADVDSNDENATRRLLEWKEVDPDKVAVEFFGKIFYLPKERVLAGKDGDAFVLQFWGRNVYLGRRRKVEGNAFKPDRIVVQFFGEFFYPIMAAAIFFAFMMAALCLWLSDSSRPDKSLLSKYGEAIKEGNVMSPPPVEDATSIKNESYGYADAEPEPKLELQEADFKQTEAGSRAVLTYNGIEFAFHYCPAGSCVVERASTESGGVVQRLVTISDGFWICETETTQEQWDAISVKQAKTSRFTGNKFPIENVSWNECESFIEKLNKLKIAPSGWHYELPSEGQWEYACCAGGTDSTNGTSVDDLAWHSGNSESSPHEVGKKTPNKWGLYDMLGNVWEWTSSRFEGGNALIFRGGSWGRGATECWTSHDHKDASSASDSLGFRPILVSDLSENITSETEILTGFSQMLAGSRAVLTYNGIEFAFRYCPAGTFTMGSPLDEEGRFSWDQEPHKANIGEGFWICETETTQAQWDAVGLKKEKECLFNGTNLPVERVSWNESESFIKELNSLNVAPVGWRFALPTEEQWEYACRAGTSGSTYGVSLDEAAWCDDNSGSRTHEVGTKLPNKWGVYDMLGNVCEWTSSKYNDGSSFVDRGGSWCRDAQDCRPAWRGYCDPAFCSDYLGFRVVLVRSQSR